MIQFKPVVLAHSLSNRKARSVGPPISIGGPPSPPPSKHNSSGGWEGGEVSRCTLGVRPVFPVRPARVSRCKIVLPS